MSGGQQGVVTRVIEVEVHPYALRLRHPLPTAWGAIDHRRGWLVGVRSDDGRMGWGDVAPWPGFGGGSDRAAADVAFIAKTLPGTTLPSDAPETLVETDVREALEARGPEARHGLELALLDLAGQRRGQSIAALLHQRPAQQVDTHRLALEPLPASPCLKVKVGADSLDADRRRLEAIRQRKPDSELRVDAGGRWSSAEAEAAIPWLAALGVALLEQPIAPGDLPTLAALRRLGAERVGAASRLKSKRRPPMCRNIRTLFNFEPPATEDEIRAASLQFVRKLSGMNRPSKVNEEVFERAVDDVAEIAGRLIASLETSAPPRDREVEAAKARERTAKRFAR